MGDLSRALAAFMILVAGCASLLALVAGITTERIDDNRRRAFLRTVTDLTGNPSPEDVRWHDGVASLCDGSVLLRGSAAGYGGPIRWLAAARPAPDGGPLVLTGVRITAHQETPGLADFLDRPESGWLATLRGRGAAEIAAVDAVSGATITSRALRRALAGALERPVPAPECPA